MSGSTARQAGLPLMLCVALLIALPGMMVETRVRPLPPAAPAALDRFLSSVCAITPREARILVAGAPPGPVFYRATYLLYPRIVHTAFPVDYAHASTALAVRWPDLRLRARRAGARYILLWSLPVVPRQGVRVHVDAGTLVEAGP